MNDKEEAVILFEQTYMKARVTKGEDGYHLGFSILGGPNNCFTFSDELEAKSAYTVLEEKYLEALRVVQLSLVQAHDDNVPVSENT